MSRPKQAACEKLQTYQKKELTLLSNTHPVLSRGVTPSLQSVAPTRLPLPGNQLRLHIGSTPLGRLPVRLDSEAFRDIFPFLTLDQHSCLDPFVSDTEIPRSDHVSSYLCLQSLIACHRSILINFLFIHC